MTYRGSEGLSRDDDVDAGGSCACHALSVPRQVPQAPHLSAKCDVSTICGSNFVACDSFVVSRWHVVPYKARGVALETTEENSCVGSTAIGADQRFWRAAERR